MKKIALLVISFTAYSAFAQDSVWDALDKRQGDLREVVSKPSSDGSTVVADTKEAIASSKRAVCNGSSQESLPLAFVSRLFQVAPAKVDVVYESNAQKLKLTTGGMIDNCSSLIKWNLDKVSSGGNVSYLVEAKFNKGPNCKVEGGVELCEYTVTEKVGIESKDKKIFVEPNHRGLEACLKETGIMSATGINEKAIVTTKKIEEFSGVKESGDVLFVSTGKPLSNVKAKFGDYVKSEGCTNYENLTEKPLRLVSAEEQAAADKAARAESLKKSCTVNDYYKLTEFMDEYQDYEANMVQVRNNLILKAVEKSAKAIDEGKYTEEDLKIISDFETYIVNPKVELAHALYEELEELTGDAKKEKEVALKAVLTDLEKLNSKPYFSGANIQKLVADGKFDDAEAINEVKLILSYNAALGKKVDKVLITPDSALVVAMKSQEKFKEAVAKERVDYKVRTGQGEGEYKAYSQAISGITAEMQSVQQKAARVIQIEMACMTNSYQAKMACIDGGGKFCYASFRNTTRCIQEGQEEVARIERVAQKKLALLTKTGKEYTEKAAHFKKLEAEGRRYIASQNGEEVKPFEEEEEPTKRGSDFDNTFQFNAPQMANNQQNPQMNQQWAQQNQMSQQAFNPWGQFMGQSQQYPMANNFSAQGNFQWNNGYNTGYAGMMNNGMAGQFNMGGNGMMGQQGMYMQQPYGMNGMMGQQGGYWNNPQQAYGNYNMYGNMYAGKI